jgi:beta-galactosidase
MGEYSHAMGNALGGFDEYWEVIYSERSLQGGFIWDWVNQGVEFDLVKTYDQSSFHHDVTYHGTLEQVKGVHGRGVALSGLDDFLEIYNDPVFNALKDHITLELWVYPRGYFDANPMIAKGGSFEITQEEKDSISFALNLNGRENELKVFVPRDWDHNWHHLAAVFNGETMKLYIDRKLAGERRASGLIERSPHPLCIGKNHKKNHENTGWFVSNYQYDNVRVYKTALSIDQVDRENMPDLLKQDVLLWLDLDEFNIDGKFLSYGATPQGSGTMDGVVSAYREPQPEGFQMKQSHAPVFVSRIGRDLGRLKIENRFHFTGLDEIETKWELVENNKVINSGDLELETPPQSFEVIDMPFKRPDFKDGAEYFFRISFQLGKKNDWGPNGHEYCFYEFTIKNLNERRPMLIPEETGGFLVEEAADHIEITANDNIYLINKNSGMLEAVRSGGELIVDHAPELNVWRRPVMNEWSEWGINEADSWYKYGLDSLVHTASLVNIEKSAYDANVSFDIESRSFIVPQIVLHHRLEYTIHSTGDLIMEHRIKPDIEVPNLYARDWFPLSYLQKIGLKFKLSKEVSDLEWFGRGPFETYPDRKTGARTGVYHKALQEINIPYIIPQDFDNRTDVRWLVVKAANGRGLLITSDQLFNASIDPYENLDEAWYPFQLKRTSSPVLNIDHRVTGVGGTPVRVRPIYRTYPEEYHYKILIRPVTRNADLFKLSNVSY